MPNARDSCRDRPRRRQLADRTHEPAAAIRRDQHKRPRRFESAPQPEPLAMIGQPLGRAHPGEVGATVAGSGVTIAENVIISGNGRDRLGDDRAATAGAIAGGLDRSGRRWAWHWQCAAPLLASKAG